MSDFSKVLSVAGSLQKQWTHSERLKLQNAVRATLPKHRAAACLRHRLGSSGVTVSITEQGHTRLGGLMVCDAHHICPVCHHKKMNKDKQAISELVRQHYQEGNILVDAVLTVPHHEGELLAIVLERLEGVWKELRKQSVWKPLAARLGIVGAIRRLEITLGPNGWHPHYHVSFLCDWGLVSELQGGMRHSVHTDAYACVSAAWAAAGKKLDLSINMHAQSVVALVAAGDAQKAVAYNLKNMGYGEKDNSMTPLDLLRVISQTNSSSVRTAAKRLFAEYTSAVKGKHIISCTGKARVSNTSNEISKSNKLKHLGVISSRAWIQLSALGLREESFKIKKHADLLCLLLLADIASLYISVFLNSKIIFGK